ncbi:MAG TPA: hypothetical protein VI956_07395 [Nitrospirota bacterium]|nr:hypothetical protein [Nitrospirota bacterium]
MHRRTFYPLRFSISYFRLIANHGASDEKAALSEGRAQERRYFEPKNTPITSALAFGSLSGNCPSSARLRGQAMGLPSHHPIP